MDNSSAIRVTYRDIDSSESLTQQVVSRIGSMSEKYFNRLVSCEVVFSKLNHHYGCKIRMHMGKLDIMAEGEGYDVQTAYRVAEEHAAKQLRRQKREIREDKPAGMVATMEVDDRRVAQKRRDDMTLEEEIESAAANMDDYDLAIRQRNSQS